MPSTQPAKKVCTVCGADVEGKPRVKDAQGRYVCKGACEAKLVKKLAAPDARDIPLAEPDDVMAKLVASSPVVNAKPCTSCGSPMREGAVVCTNCGTNIESGKKIKTAIIKEKEQKAPKLGKYKNKYAYSDEPNVWKLFLIFSVGLSVVGLLPALKPELFLFTIIVMFIANLLALAGSAMSAFRNEQTLWAVCHVCLFVPFVNGIAGIGVLIYNALFNPDSRSRALYWATFVGTVATFIGIAISVANNVPLTVPGVGAIGGGTGTGGAATGQ